MKRTAFIVSEIDELIAGLWELFYMHAPLLCAGECGSYSNVKGDTLVCPYNIVRTFTSLIVNISIYFMLCLYNFYVQLSCSHVQSLSCLVSSAALHLATVKSRA